jgi:hypothetical protein
MEGMELLRVLIQATGLPGELVEREVMGLLNDHGLEPATITLDEVRDLLAIYLQDVLLEAKATY